MCERCLAKGRSVEAVPVHHKDRDPYNNEFRNLESLCNPCHEREHAAERWGRVKCS